MAVGTGLLIGALTSGILGLGKSIFGGVQASKGKKELNTLLKNQPKYSIPEEYMKALGIYSNLATGEMPGQRRTEQLIGETSARAMTGAERGAISSTAYQGAVQSSQDKELQAIMNLAQMGAQYKTQAAKDLAGAETQMGQLKDQQFKTNILDQWGMKADIAANKMGVGQQNLFAGLGDISSSVMQFTGTKYYTDILAELQKNKV
jgi:hypothetical protein